MTTNLEERINAALSSDTIESSAIAALIAETETAISAAEQNAVAERERALELNSDPRKASEAVTVAELTRDRLKKALPLLQDRFLAVQAQEYVRRWTPHYEQVRERRDAIALEFSERYPALVAELSDLFQRMNAVDAECSQVNAAAPFGERRRLLGAELTSRRRPSFSIEAPSITQNAQLPDYDNSAKMALSPNKQSFFDPSLYAPPPYDVRFSSDWWMVGESKQQADRERAAQEAAAAAQAKKDFYAPRP